jgi:hypothetical protein
MTNLCDSDGTNHRRRSSAEATGHRTNGEPFINDFEEIKEPVFTHVCLNIVRWHSCV